MSSTRESVIGAVVDRLEMILISGGFATDAGVHVFTGETPTFGPDDSTAAIALVVGSDDPGHQGENVAYTLPLDVQVIAPVGVGALLAIEATIADVKRAIETDRDLGGLLPHRGLERGPTRQLPREEGSDFIGAAVEYRAYIVEQWGNP